MAAKKFTARTYPDSLGLEMEKMRYLSGKSWNAPIPPAGSDLSGNSS
jgi:hypothetical protein